MASIAFMSLPLASVMWIIIVMDVSRSYRVCTLIPPFSLVSPEDDPFECLQTKLDSRCVKGIYGTSMLKNFGRTALTCFCNYLIGKLFDDIFALFSHCFTHILKTFPTD